MNEMVFLRLRGLKNFLERGCRAGVYNRHVLHKDELMNTNLKEKSYRANFTVDAALLRELGERLVGKPHIALAELVKNSYDADATEVVIRFGGGK